MAKLAQATSKHVIHAKFDAEGTIEKPDVIGAVFGQTEGLLGSEMDLRELQQTGRIGRIDVDIQLRSGKATGTIFIPSSLDSSETALIAATLETIERIGPCNAKLRIDKIEDVRVSKRKYVIERAKELLAKILEEGVEAQEISDQIKEAVRSGEVTTFNGLPAGPAVQSSDNIIIVEGRADVINLLRSGIKNAIALEGTSVPKQIPALAKQKEVTVFLDGDRGGNLILRELTAVAEIDFVSRAPDGKEVEDLTKKEIFKALREKAPIDQVKTDPKPEVRTQIVKTTTTATRTNTPQPSPARKAQIDPDKAAKLKETLNGLTGTRAACFLSSDGEVIGKVPVKEMLATVKEIDASSLVFDGEVDQKLINLASQNGIRNLIGMSIKGRITPYENMFVGTGKDL